MTKEFCTYNQALALKELGFDEPCFAVYYDTKEFKTYTGVWVKFNSEFNGKGVMSAPLYQQAFRWFREKHGLLHDITLTLNINDELESFYILIHKLNGLVMNEDDDIELNVKTTNKEEAESACLDKLIEICKTK